MPRYTLVEHENLANVVVAVEVTPKLEARVKQHMGVIFDDHAKALALYARVTSSLRHDSGRRTPVRGSVASAFVPSPCTPIHKDPHARAARSAETS